MKPSQLGKEFKLGSQEVYAIVQWFKTRLHALILEDSECK